MSSFIDKINALKVRLERNADLQNYAAQNFGKQFTVKKSFRDITEISLEELPIIMILRPSVSRNTAGNAVTKEHEVDLVLGFRQEDSDLALDQFIEVDELLEAAAITKTTEAGDVGMYITPLDSANDTGIHAPAYFQGMTLRIKNR
jgi:hypothetical protein